MVANLENRRINRQALTGMLLLAAATVGVMAATPKGRGMIKRTIDTGDELEEEDDESTSLVSWLKDAYAMEEAQIQTLNSAMDDFKDYEEIYETINQHLQITMKQKDDVKKALASLGEKPAKHKEILGSLIGRAPAIEVKMFEDKKVKNILSMIAAEQFEQACYEALATAAEAEGKKALARTMQRIAREEKDMQQWLEKTLPKLVKEELAA